jgi:hypothetical protein
MRKSALRRILVGLVLAVSATSLPLVTTAEVALAASCSAGGCDYQDPATTGCSTGSYTVVSAGVFSAGVRYGTVELRWSPTCQTNWSRLTINAGAANPNHYDRQAWVHRQSPAASIGFDWTGDGSVIYSDMLYAPGCAKAYASLTLSATTWASGTAMQPGCNF